MIIFSTSATGRKLEWTKPTERAAGQAGILTITDNNPSAHLTWTMSRGVLIRIGVRCLLAALKR